MKDKIISIIAVCGGSIAGLLGGWDTGLKALLICMLFDYATGIIVAGCFQKSHKTETGGLSSSVGFKGLMKKTAMLAVVAVGQITDIITGTTVIRDGIVIGFTANEIISIIENVGLMGVPLPKTVTKMLAILKEKTDETEDMKNDGV